jgi:glycosyltransferase involved in cell wall biosynthesis
MNVFRVTRAHRPGADGLSNHVAALSREQARAGHAVTVLQPQQPPGFAGGVRMERVALAPRVLARIGTKRATLEFALRAAARLRDAHRREPIDVVHCHGDVIEAAVLGRWGRAAGVPVVLTIHGCPPRNLQYRVFARRFLAAVSHIIVVSPEIRAELVRVGVRPERISVLSSGVDLSRFAGAAAARPAARARAGLPDGVTVVVAVGRLHPVKGLEYLVRAAALLPDPDRVRVVIVGDGPERETLAALAAQTRNVVLAGAKGAAEVTDYLLGADLFVLPSVDLPGQREGTPTALMEAMAAGLPVIVTDSGGSPALAEASGGGVVVPQRDPRRLAAAIGELAGDPARCAAMGRANRAYAQQKDWKTIAGSVQEIYERVRHPARAGRG